jgi:uncharacterized protein (TIGR03118 family)
MNGIMAKGRPRTIAFSAFGSLLAVYGTGALADAAPTTSLTADPMTIVLGQSATLAWSASQGASCEASGGWEGPEPALGTAEVTPSAVGAVTYTLTCTGTDGSSSTDSVTLTVEPASAYTTTNLVEDFEGGAAVTTDANLVNPWGLAFGPTTPVWVANNATETSTLYDGNGRPSPLIVQFAAGADAASFAPTGVVFNGTEDFVVSGADQTGPALFIFDGEGGMIAGWSPVADSEHAITTYTAEDGAVYKGLALANDGTGNFLYAADFANGKVDVFDATFAIQPATETSFAFSDPALPDGYAPFGIQAVNNGPGGEAQIYVSYAKRDEAVPDDDAPGPGLGIVNVFDTNGNLLARLVGEGGELNAPWGMALAPADFGTLSDALLIGNFGDGTIHGYDPADGRYLGAVTDGGGTPFAVPGLWGIAFGNDASNQPHATLFFAAGTNAEANGLYGRIDLGEAAPALGEPPVVTLTAPEGDLSGTVTLTADVEDTVAVTEVAFLVNGNTPVGTATSAPFAFSWDTTTLGNGSATLRAVAVDANGNVGSSAILTVSVANAGTATLAQIQETVFTPRCSGCHDGSQPADGSLPGALDLRSGVSFASLVNVPSLEQPSLMRVQPAEPENSYLIHKLEGTPDISGARMPFGGPFLEQTTIEQVAAWIASGAEDN